MNINATLLAQTFIFVVFVFICYRYVWPPILSMMNEREKRIADGLEAAKKADDSLEEAKLASAKELEGAKKQDARATQIVGDAKSKAEDEAEKIITSGSKNLENEINKTKEQLRSDLSEIVVDTAQKIIDAEIDPGKHEELIKKAAKEI